MTVREKKAKAAAIAVSTVLAVVREPENIRRNDDWRKVSMVVKKQGILRFRGRIPSNYRIRM